MYLFKKIESSSLICGDVFCGCYTVAAFALFQIMWFPSPNMAPCQDKQIHQGSDQYFLTTI